MNLTKDVQFFGDMKILRKIISKRSQIGDYAQKNLNLSKAPRKKRSYVQGYFQSQFFWLIDDFDTGNIFSIKHQKIGPRTNRF